MARRILKAVLMLGLVVTLLAGLLFGNYARSVGPPEWMQLIAREIQAACRDAGTQWMVIVCLVSYFVVFLFLETKTKAQSIRSKVGDEAELESRHPSLVTRHLFFNPDFWLFVFVVLVLLRYAFDYANATRSLQVVVLLTGIVGGKGVAVWATWQRSPSLKSEVQSLKLGEVSAPSSILNPRSSSRSFAILNILTLLLACASLWHPERGMEFQYRGQPRWTGPWDNPNLYGVLMGVGTVLAMGLFVSRLKSKDSSRANEECGLRRAEYRRWGSVLFFSIAAGLCGYGLLKSYSRGAWLGTAVGLAFLMWKWINREPHEMPEKLEQKVSNPRSRIWRISRLRGNLFPSSILLFSILVLSFWQFRHTESPLARRLFSVGNPNDFSWRNRVTAWQGAGRMMLHKPLAGFGWGKAEEVYSKEYRAARLEESAAIRMNDYLMLGISAGAPALACLLVYVSLTLCRGSRVGGRDPVGLQTSDLRLQTSVIAASGAMVLLLGFWFDGGLFKLPTCVVFWVLVELARGGGLTTMPVGRARHSVRAVGGASVRASRLVSSLASPTQGGTHGVTRPTLALRWLAGIFAIISLGLTVIHLRTPQLMVSERSLSIARKFLVPSKEKVDFEFLAAKPVWSGQPLKTLLQHAHLANYNRSLVNWKLDDSIYQQFVLSPEIDPAINDLNWRRPLWEYFYPRIRKENSPETAAGIVIRHLRERAVLVSGVTTSASPDGEKGGAKFPSRWDLWWQDPLDAEELELVGIAALRAVGIPARLTDSGRAEYWTGEKWEPASR